MVPEKHHSGTIWIEFHARHRPKNICMFLVLFGIVSPRVPVHKLSKVAAIKINCVHIFCWCDMSLLRMKHESVNCVCLNIMKFTFDELRGIPCCLIISNSEQNNKKKKCFVDSDTLYEFIVKIIHINYVMHRKRLAKVTRKNRRFILEIYCYTIIHHIRWRCLCNWHWHV